MEAGLRHRPTVEVERHPTVAAEVAQVDSEAGATPLPAEALVEAVVIMVEAEGATAVAVAVATAAEAVAVVTAAEADIAKGIIA